MKINKIEAALQSIRSKYARIREMTEILDADTAVETCEKVLRQRAGLLSEIEQEANSLDCLCAHWREQCNVDQGLATLKSEIQLLISAAVALDSTIQDRLARRIGEVKNELSRLSSTSKVALSYARHVA